MNISSECLDLNAQLNIYGLNGEIQTDKDKEAARQFFLQHVNQNTVFFHSLGEKIDYMTTNEYWSKEVFKKYSPEFVKELFRRAYGYKFRFGTFVGAYKFYTSYALKNYEGSRYLERYEDRVCMVALDLADGDEELAERMVDEIVSNRFQPATPTFLNAGRADAGELVSCFLLRVEDNMESIGRAINSSLQLSKRGGGVALLLSNLRESGAPIKNVEGASSGVVPVMKILEDSFSYANQLGARQGAGAVYLHAHHPDIMRFLDTKRENADEKIRIKSLSLGVVIPDITFDLARQNKDMYLFSPYDVEKVYGKPFSDISVSEHYDDMVANPEIKKTKLNARKFFQTLAEIQFESGYPYVVFEDTVNRANNIEGRVNMSNLCVAPETRVLTDNGYEEIATLDGKTVNAWNGQRFSPSVVAKTGENQELLRVHFNNGASLDVTPYHKFYVKTGYGTRKVVETEAANLKAGDMLDKFDLPVVNGGADLSHAYTNGFFTADGTVGSGGQPIVALYGKKKQLVEQLDIKSGTGKEDAQGRLNYRLVETLAPKYFVPTSFSVQSRLDWLAGLIDGDGYGNGTVGIQIGSSKPEFLEEVRVLLTTLGVSSTVRPGNKGGKRVFKEGQKAYDCADTYRLMIAGSSVQKLRTLGLKTYRIQLEAHDHSRAATSYIKVESVERTGRISDTYCLNEPESHKVVFEGIQTGNCSEILQVNSASEYYPNLDYQTIGNDISCNLGSMNIAKVMEQPGAIRETVETAVEALSQVSRSTAIDAVPSIMAGNDNSHSIGLGQMNLHGFLAQHHIEYGSPESIEFVHAYFSTVRFYALVASMRLAQLYGTFAGFEKSGYADGSALEEYERVDYRPTSKWLVDLMGECVPSPENWKYLNDQIQANGLYNAYLLAVPPTGNISYVNGATPSIHPVTAPVEIRKEGKMGRVYYPAPGLSKDTLPYYLDAYETGYEKIIDVYAAATKHTDQGLSLTLFFKDSATTRDINKAQIYAWRKGIKTLYYIRLRQEALAGTEVSQCVSCAL